MVLLLSLGLLLVSARVLGEMVQRIKLPAVVGEILAGILLGPTLLGTVAPQTFHFLFPQEGANATLLEGFSVVAIVLFLMVAGMEVNLSTIWQQGRAALIVSSATMLLPFAAGFIMAWIMPDYLGRATGHGTLVFALFFGTLLAITALPVIAKILLDLRLYRTDLGMLIIATAVFCDVAGWFVFAGVMALLDPAAAGMWSITRTLLLTLGFAALVLTAGRWLIHRILPWLQAHTQWPGSVLVLALSMALLAAALTEWIGVHAIFGSFLVGIAVGDSSHLREQTRVMISRFISYFFAPLFFATIGLRLNFLQNLDLGLCALVLGVALVSKITGGRLGGRWSGLPKRESWVLGLALNTWGAMEIILGLLAWENNLITERLFVVIVMLVLVTSLLSGMSIERLLAEKIHRPFTSYLLPKGCLFNLASVSRQAVLMELSKVAAEAAQLSVTQVQEAVWHREQTMATGIGNGLAIPHARISGLKEPLVGLGVASSEIDFDAYDGQPAQLIFLVLVPVHDDTHHLQILADISRTFRRAELRDKVMQTRSYTEFVALIKTEKAESTESHV
ncbi:MAG: Glutathione-regulated potassium-efflux system protein KefB [Phycisphaerae bacterium]|nr:Glutathione-regulated potassium-efflux system protein KefB [Phycisphaerae bacterium]